MNIDLIRRAAAGYVDDFGAKLSNDEQNKQHPSWADAAAKLARAFQNMPEEHAVINRFLSTFVDTPDRFPDAFCAALQPRHIIKCLPPRLADANSISSTVRSLYSSVFDKGTSTGAAWDFEIIVHLHKKAAEAIRWELLPFNVRSVRIEGRKPTSSGVFVDAHAAAQPMRRRSEFGGKRSSKQQSTTAAPKKTLNEDADIDAVDEIDAAKTGAILPRIEIDDILSRLPPHVSSLVLSFVDVHMSSEPEDVKVADVLDSLEMHHCRVSESFLHTGPWFSTLTKLVLEDCHFYFFDTFPVNGEKAKSHENELVILAAFSKSLEQLRTLVVTRPLFAANAPFFFLPQITELVRDKHHLVDLFFVYSPHAMSPAQLSADRATRYSRTWLHHRNEFYDALSRLESLKHLHLENVELASTPALAKELRLPPALVVLQLFNVGYKEFPDLTSLPPSVSEVDFSLNDIATEFPLKQIAAAPNVKRVRIARNKLHGELDTATLPQHLLELNCSGNALSGALDLTSLPKRIDVFDVSHNKFSGRVNMLQLPSTVQFLFVNHNKLTGRYDVSRLPLLAVKVMFSNNEWDSLLPSK